MAVLTQTVLEQIGVLQCWMKMASTSVKVAIGNIAQQPQQPQPLPQPQKELQLPLQPPQQKVVSA